MENYRVGQSSEDYLKTIFKLIRMKGACRSIDLAKEMHVSKSSVSIAIKKLENDAFVKRDERNILLTGKGHGLAENLYERDQFFFQWFKAIGVDDQTAKADACKVEHAISEETYEKLQAYVQTAAAE